MSNAKISISRRLVSLFLAIHFLNIAASFYYYESKYITQEVIGHVDPVDNLVELALEYFLEMEDDTIPDTEIPHEKRKNTPLKWTLAWHQLDSPLKFPSLHAFAKLNSFHIDLYELFPEDIPSPPPRNIV